MNSNRILLIKEYKMEGKIKLYSNEEGCIAHFLKSFYQQSILLPHSLEWEKSFPDPVQLADMIGVFIENDNFFSTISMWVSIDEGLFIHISEDNADDFIRYLYERYPY